MVGDDDRIVDEDSVGAVGLELVVVNHLRPRLAQDGHQGIVLLLGDLQVRPIGVVPLRRIAHSEGLVWPLDQHLAQRLDHALAAVISAHFDGK